MSFWFNTPMRATARGGFNVLRTDRRAVESSDGRLPCKRGFCRFTQVFQAYNCSKSCPKMHAISSPDRPARRVRESLGAPSEGPGGPVGAPRAKNRSKMVPRTQLGPKLGPTWGQLWANSGVRDSPGPLPKPPGNGLGPSRGAPEPSFGLPRGGSDAIFEASCSLMPAMHEN